MEIENYKKNYYQLLIKRNIIVLHWFVRMEDEECELEKARDNLEMLAMDYNVTIEPDSDLPLSDSD